MRLCDLLGREFRFDHPPRRVVSLVPSLTETLFDLGAGENVVGITDFCIFPPDLALPRVGGTKTPRIDAIRELQPDLVYMNLEENLKKHAEAIEEFAPVFVTEPKTIDDVRLLIETLGAIHGCEARARELAALLDPSSALRAPSPRTRGEGVDGPRPAQRGEGGRRPGEGYTFLVPIWKKPWMWCGGDTYVSNLVESTGGRNLMRDRERYPAMDLDCAMALEPDVIFLPDEPYEFSEEDAAAIRSLSNARIVGPFPGHLFTWHGTRTIHGLRFLRQQRSLQPTP